MRAAQVRVTRQGLDLVTVPADRRFLLFGRSPECDGVLRAKDVAGIQYLVRWHGHQEPNEGDGFWTVSQVPLLPPEVRENRAWDQAPVGRVLESGAQIDGFTFALVSDRLAERKLESPLFRNTNRAFAMTMNVDRPSSAVACLEVITARSDSETVASIEHFPIDAPPSSLAEADWIQVRGGPSNTMSIAVETAPGTQIRLNGKVSTGAPYAQVTLDALGVVRIDRPGSFIVMRFVPRVQTQIDSASAIELEPFHKVMGVSLSLTAVLMAAALLHPPAGEPVPPRPPVRTATVEVRLNTSTAQMIPELREPANEKKEVPPAVAPIKPPPTAQALPNTAQKSAKPPVPQTPVTKKPEPVKAEANVNKKTPVASAKAPPLPVEKLKAAAPANAKKFAAAVAGLNNQAEKTNFNTIGLLGRLNKTPDSKSRVRADMLVNSGTVSRTVAGDEGVVQLRQPAAGVLDEAAAPAEADPEAIETASTRLSADQIFQDTPRGPIAKERTRARLGMGSGEGIGGLVGTSSDQGSQDSAGGSEGGITLRGGLSRKAVLAALEKYRSQIKTCYDGALVANARVRGRVVYEWTISPNGSVSSIRLVDSKAKSAVLEACVKDVLKEVVFPVARSGQATVVIYPFIFKKLK